LFDGTEIDEILALRNHDMTDDEKREMRKYRCPRRRILERTEALPIEHLAKLHGTLRDLRSLKEGDVMNEWEWHLLEAKKPVDDLRISGIGVRPGSRVKLRPRAGGDVMDIALTGKTGDH